MEVGEEGAFLEPATAFCEVDPNALRQVFVFCLCDVFRALIISLVR